MVRTGEADLQKDKATNQKVILILPWKILGFCPDASAEIWPKVEEVKAAAGVAKFGWFGTLNASSRRVAARLSWIGKIRETCASN